MSRQKHGPVAKPTPEARQDKEWLRIQRTEQERAGLAALEDEPLSAAPPPVGPPSGDDPIREEEEGDACLAESDAGAAETSSPPPENGDGREEPAPRPWTRRLLLGSRPEAMLVRLKEGTGGLEAHLTVEPQPRTAEALYSLRDLLQDRFRRTTDPNGAALYTPEEWAELLGRRKAPPVRRLILLQRLTTTGEEPFRREDGTLTTPNNLGLGNYRRKFAAFPDGVPFSIGLLLTGGRSGAKGSPGEGGADDHPFNRMPLTLRLVVLARALRREQEEGWVRKDKEFRVLLRDEAHALTGVAMDALPTTSVRRFRDSLTRLGLGRLFPKASDRKKNVAAPAGRGGPE